MILTVTVNPALDKNYLVPGFGLSGIHRAQSMSIVPAGKGINVARVLKTLGVKTLATGIVGGYTGRQIEAGLKGLDVPYDFVRIRAESRANALIYDPQRKVHTELKEPGPDVPTDAWKRLEAKIMHLAPACSWVVFAGSPPPSTPAQVYAPLIRGVKALGVKVALDTRGPWLQEGVKAQPDLIKPNWEEFQELVGRCQSTMEGLSKARDLVNQGLATIVVSMGGQGAMAVHQGQSYLAEQLPPIEVMSPIGSGDTLVAGLLSQWVAGREFAGAFRFGLAAATSNAAHFGAGEFDPLQTEALDKAITINRIEF
ncbi:MAG: 1-phosphofructokinase family hexose kinase [Limnochordia bacterium]|jgi:tagatose 6-phosphate kinase|nr:1-phosphofructokinase family hexose kinase [Limnochordia bacterium]